MHLAKKIAAEEKQAKQAERTAEAQMAKASEDDAKAKKEQADLAAERRKVEKEMAYAQNLKATEENKDAAIRDAKSIADAEMAKVQARENHLAKDGGREEKKNVAERQQADEEMARAQKESEAAEEKARKANADVEKAEKMDDDAHRTKSHADREMERRQDHVVASSGRRNEALKRADELPLKQRSDVLLFSRKMHKEELEAMAAVRQMEAEAKHDLEDTAKQEASTVHHASSEVKALEDKKRRQIAMAKREAASAEQIAASAAAEKRHADQEIASVAGMLKEGKTAEQKGQQLLRQASAKEAKLSQAQKAVEEAQAKAAKELQEARAAQKLPVVHTTAPRGKYAGTVAGCPSHLLVQVLFA
eukprot:g28549.t1